jgi:hypothetical protein
MNNTQRALAVLRYEEYDRLPLVHFGYWRETLAKWRDEGHISAEEAETHRDGNEVDRAIARRLGFDFNWQTMFQSNCGPMPAFAPKVVKEFPDGSRHVLNGDGVVTLVSDHASGIPPHISHILTDRASWEEHFRRRLEPSRDRVDWARLAEIGKEERDSPIGLHCGSLFGRIRDIIGLEGVSYLYADDEELYREIIDTVGNLCYSNVEAVLASGVKFDFAHFWEDICFKNGPLVSPSVFRELVGPHYKRITELVGRHGLDIVSLDCDGWIDALVPIWFENGVNTMFPIEVGTWGASIAPWRKQFGKGLRGVGGMNKTVFAFDREAIDAEIERLKPLVGLGGYIPCPDHRIAPDAKWDNVRYYCDRMHAVFG